MKNNICPICGKDNECAIANGKNPNKCWCMNFNIKPEVLNIIKTKYKDKACICKNCLEEISKEHS